MVLSGRLEDYSLGASLHPCTGAESGIAAADQRKTWGLGPRFWVACSRAVRFARLGVLGESLQGYGIGWRHLGCRAGADGGGSVQASRGSGHQEGHRSHFTRNEVCDQQQRVQRGGARGKMHREENRNEIEATGDGGKWKAKSGRQEKGDSWLASLTQQMVA